MRVPALVACVKQGEKYGPEYVTRLRDGVARHMTVPHRFVCFTDTPFDGVECHPLPADLPGWWAKLGLFKLGRRLIYFDLDVVVSGNLTALAGLNRFSIIKDWWLPGFNSSVMVLTGNERSVWSKFRPEFIPDYPQGDQQWITAQLPDAFTFPPEWFPSFKADKCFESAPEHSKAVIFHGNPKPHELGGWVADEWRQLPNP